MADTSRGLPELSSPAWFATLVASLVTVALAVYPFVAYPAIRRQKLFPQGLLAPFVTPQVVGGFAAVTFAVLVVTFTGKRSGAARSQWAFIALAVAVLGVALLVGGLMTLGRTAP